jgi:large subunit ribosomal protein L1
MDVAKAVREAKAGKIEFRVEKAGIVHVPVGKKSFEVPKLADNVRSLLNALVKAKPSTAKGQYVKSVTLSTTMGPGIRVDPNSIDAEAT